MKSQGQQILVNAAGGTRQKRTVKIVLCHNLQNTVNDTMIDYFLFIKR